MRRLRTDSSCSIRGDQAGGTVSEQPYDLDGKTYRNVIALFGPDTAERIVVGAHYDSVAADVPAADDNASGVAGLIELAYWLGATSPRMQIELVAYTLEEGQPNSQRYPHPLMKLFYPTQGNFIAVVGKLNRPMVVRRVKAAMQAASLLPVCSINAPRSMPGIDFSDHRNYWGVGYDAVMITDTALYRNPNYHTPETQERRWTTSTWPAWCRVCTLQCWHWRSSIAAPLAIEALFHPI